MSETESTQLWNDEDDDLQGGQAFSDALASLGTHLHEQQEEHQLTDDEEMADAEMYEEGVGYETDINQNGEPAEVSYSDLTEEDAFTMDHGTQPEQDAGLSLDDELDNLIPDEPAAMFSADTDLSLDDELDHLIPDEPVAAVSYDDTDLPLDDEDEEPGFVSSGDMDIELDLDDEPDHFAAAPVEHSAGEMSLGAELDAILNVSSDSYAPADELAEEPAEEELAFDSDEELADVVDEAADEEAEPVAAYSDDSLDDESYAEESYEAPAASEEAEEVEDEGYLAEEEPAAADFAAYPSYEEPEDEMESYEADTAVEEVAEPEIQDVHETSPMAALVGGADGTDDFNLATLTQLVDEIRQESDRVAEMKESVAKALSLIQEMSESLKS